MRWIQWRARVDYRTTRPQGLRTLHRLQSAVRLGAHRFFLVVGANESGKSTSLRAIGDWLFGFPASTSDDYVHSMKQLRVGGRLLDPATGNVLECLRRKGNKATLLAMDNQTAIADQKLDAFTQGISRTMFEKQFGISHTQLVSGGQEVISGDGDIGELLFSTGAGLGRSGS